jgi:hypothetical protein
MPFAGRSVPKRYWEKTPPTAAGLSPAAQSEQRGVLSVTESAAGLGKASLDAQKKKKKKGALLSISALVLPTCTKGQEESKNKKGTLEKGFN